MSEIQELIAKFSVSKDRETYVKIIEQLRTAETLWAAYFPLTNNYYLDILKGKKTAAFIFSEKEYYNIYEDRLKLNNIKITPKENTLENRMQFFGDLYRSGFELVVVDNGQKFVIIDLFDIIKKPDFSELPEINRPVMNPSLVAAANNLFQAGSLNRPVRQLEEKMYRELYSASFLLPIDTSALKLKSIDSETGKNVVEKDSQIRIPLITNEKGQNFIAVFTDWDELRRFDPEQKFGGNIIGFKDIKYFCSQNDGLVVNPFGFNMILNEERIKLVEDVVTGKAAIPEDEPGKTRTVKLKNPNPYPTRMVKTIKKCLKKHKEVRSAYLTLMLEGERVSWLIVLDIDGDGKKIFDDIAQEAMPMADGKLISFVTLKTKLGGEVAANSEPFYKAK